MPLFNYEGHLKNGRPVASQIEAETEEEANEMLRQAGVHVREVSMEAVKLVYDHPPKPRPVPQEKKAEPEPSPFIDVDNDPKVKEPEAEAPPEETPAQEPEDHGQEYVPSQEPEVSAQEAEYDAWKTFLCQSLLHVEAARKELKGFQNLFKGEGKTKAAREKSRKAKAKEFLDQVDRACDVALGLGIHTAFMKFPNEKKKPS